MLGGQGTNNNNNSNVTFHNSPVHSEIDVSCRTRRRVLLVVLVVAGITVIVAGI